MLTRAKLSRAPDDATLVKILENGIRGTEMPGSGALSDREMRQTAAYVRSLGRVIMKPVPGDATLGAEIYRGKGNCAGCHSIHGEGAVAGPDLSGIGDSRSAAYLRESIVNPAAGVPDGYLLVTVVSKNGARITGVRVNVDSFSIQIRDSAGRSYSFWKQACGTTNQERNTMDSLRRNFLTRSIAIATSALTTRPKAASAAGEVKRRSGAKIKLALNSYSFNRPLTSGQMTLDDVIDYCAAHNIDGVDLTGYYFPGYPKVPTDEYIYDLKRKAYLNGVSISGTGVRNDFTLVDAAARKGSIQLVKDWVDVGQKLGASFIRVFSGRSIPKDSSFEKVLEWMVPAFQECAEYGKKHGVIIGLQHHDDFLKTADQTIQVVKAVNSDWFNVILDVGSLRQGDPYQEIEKLLPYACTWQIKETVYVNGKSTPIDLVRIRKIIDKVGFRGFLPIEALGQGDASAIVTAFFEKVRAAMS